MKSEDFYGLYRQLTFAPGETVKRVDIVIVDDAIAEPYEQFTVRIWDEGGRTIATRSIGIVDDD